METYLVRPRHGGAVERTATDTGEATPRARRGREGSVRDASGRRNGRRQATTQPTPIPTA